MVKMKLELTFNKVNLVKPISFHLDCSFQLNILLLEWRTFPHP